MIYLLGSIILRIKTMRKNYPSDLNDDEWEVLSKYIPKQKECPALKYELRDII